MDEFADLQLERGIWLASVDRLADAEEALRSALSHALDADSAARICVVLADVLRRLNRDAEVVGLYLDTCRMYTDDVALQMRCATECLGADRFPEALRAIDVAIAGAPAASNLRHIKAIILHRAGDTRRALSCCQEAIWMEPPSKSDLSMMGLFAMRLGEYSTAADAYRAAVQIDPRDADEVRHLGMALSAMGNHAEAMEAYHEALRLDPNYAKARVEVAAWQWFAGCKEPGRANLESEVALEPQSHVANFALGLVYVADRDYGRAVKCLRRAIAARPDDAGSYVYLAHALDGLGNRGAAIDILHQARDADPDDPRPVDLLLFYSASRKDPEQAAEIFRTLIARNPDDPQYHYSLGVALNQLTQYPEAEDALNEALRLDPKRANAHCRLGCIFEKTERPRQALDSYEKAIELAADPYAFFNAARLLCKNGHRRQAQAYWTRAIELGCGDLKRDAEAALEGCRPFTVRIVRALVRRCRRLYVRRTPARHASS